MHLSNFFPTLSSFVDTLGYSKLVKILPSIKGALFPFELWQLTEGQSSAKSVLSVLIYVLVICIWFKLKVLAAQLTCPKFVRHARKKKIHGVRFNTVTLEYEESYIYAYIIRPAKLIKMHEERNECYYASDVN